MSVNQRGLGGGGDLSGKERGTRVFPFPALERRRGPASGEEGEKWEVSKVTPGLAQRRKKIEGGGDL